METALDDKDYDTCIDSARRVLTQESNEPKVQFMAHHYLCRCYRENSEATQAINSCQEALNIRKEPDVLCDRAEAYLTAEMFDDGNLVLYIFIVRSVYGAFPLYNDYNVYFFSSNSHQRFQGSVRGRS